MKVWYHETSAVNFFQSKITEGTLATRTYQLEKGRDWRLSPITIWEIILTNQDERRELLIDFCQHLYSNILLPPPSELIIGFLDSGAQIKEPRRELSSKIQLSNTWAEIVADRRKTLHYDKTLVKERADFLRLFTKEIYRVVSDEDVLLSSDLFHGRLDMTLSQLVREAEKELKAKTQGKEFLSRKIALFYALLILCAEAEFDNSAIKEYWKRVGIACTLRRVEYVVQNLPIIIQRGPFVLMSLMTLSQAEGKFSRGLWFDCLHSVYLTYSDIFLTNDSHFAVLKKRIHDPRLKNRLLLLSEVELFSVNRDWLGKEV